MKTQLLQEELEFRSGGVDGGEENERVTEIRVRAGGANALAIDLEGR